MSAGGPFAAAAPRSSRVATWTLPCAAFLLCAALSRWVLEDVPHVMDAVAYRFQAEIFASGRVVAPGTALWRSFHVPTIITTPERRYAIYPPGWPLLLAAGVRLGLPQLVSPLLAGLFVALLLRAGTMLFDARVARVAAVLALLSPFFAFMGASYLSHMACATALLASLAALLQGGASPSARGQAAWGIAAGLGSGLSLLVRPYSAALGLGCIAVTLLLRREGRWRRVLPGAIAGGLLGVAVFLAYNRATTGSALRTGYQVFAGDFSFRGIKGQFRPSLLVNFLLLFPEFLHELSREIWGGPYTDLLLLVAAMPLRNRRVWAVTLPPFLFLAGHSLYFYFDLCMGPRFAFEAMPWILLASARGAVELHDRTANSVGARAVLAALALAALLAGPARFYPYLCRYYAANYFGQGGELLRIVDAQPLGRALVITRRGTFEAFQNLHHRNALDLERGDVVFAKYHDAEIAKLVAAFPGRDLWLLDVDYQQLPSRNIFPDRFTITRATLQRVHWDPASARLDPAARHHASSP